MPNVADFFLNELDKRFGEVFSEIGSIGKKVAPAIARHPVTAAAGLAGLAVFTPVGRSVVSNLAGGAAYKAVQQPITGLFGGNNENKSQTQTNPQADTSGLWGPQTPTTSKARARKAPVKRKAVKRKAVKRKAVKRKAVKRKAVKRKVKAR